MRTVAVPAVALLLVLLPPGPVVAAPTGGDEFLDMDLAQLMNITVTSVAKKEQRLSDAPAAVFVITQEDIRRSGVTTVPEALAMAPGLQVARVSASTWSVASRGFSGFTSNKLLVLMDGRSVYSPAFSRKCKASVLRHIARKEQKYAPKEEVSDLQAGLQPAR